MKKILGLDLGVASIGWALIEHENGDGRILGTGVRIFQSNEQRADAAPGESSNADRRTKRSMRRQRDRRTRRKVRLYNYLKKTGMAPSRREMDSWIRINPYEIRARALDEQVTLQEFGRALYHLGQRRGYLSNRKSGDDKEGVVMQGISALRDRMKALNCRTYGEYCYAILDEKQCDRNQGKRYPADFDWRVRDKYTHRSMFLEEFDRLWDSQCRFHPEVLNPESREIIHEIIFHQRPLKIQKHLIGKCPLEPDKKRIAKGHLLFQEFRVIKNVNNLTVEDENGFKIELSREDRQALKDLLDKKDKATFSQLKKVLIKRGTISNENAVFNLEKGDRKYLEGNSTNHRLSQKKAFGKEWYELDETFRSHVVDVLLNVDKPDVVKDLALNRWGRNEEQADHLSKLTLEKGYGSFSQKAIRTLLPYLKEGLEESSAIKKAGYKIFEQRTGKLQQLPPPPAIRNPVVYHALVELRKVVNAIIRKYGMPDIIRVELTRDLKASYDQRQKMNREMRELEARNEKARQALRQSPFNVPDPGHADILWYNLWEECKHQCPYTGKAIPAEAFNSGEFQIEHIVPFSRSLDNSYANKTLCEADFNRRKGNRTPWECVKAGLIKEDDLLQRIRNLPWKKRRKFTLQEIDTDEFLNRQLSDTRYISREASLYLKQLACESVEVVKGQTTSLLRHLWGLNSVLNLEDESMKNRDDHRHHAIDAIVVALTSRAMLKKLSDENKRIHAPEWMDSEESGAVQYRKLTERITFSSPWEKFRDEVRWRIGEIIVSHRVSRKVSGPLHEETFYGPTNEPAPRKKEMMVVRKPVHALSKKELNLIRDPRIREIVNCEVNRRMEQGLSQAEAIASLEADPPYLISEKAKVPIRKVRLLMEKLPELMHSFTLENGTVYRKALYGNNHHIAIYEVTNEKGEKKKVGDVIPLMEAARRLKNGEPVVLKELPGTDRFLFSLAINDMVISEDGEVFRVQKIASSGVLTFRRHEVALKGQSDPGVWRKSPGVLEVKKIKVSPIGEIFFSAND